MSREAANAPGAFGETPLMDAATAGSVEAMAFLIDKGADVNAQNPFGTTALMMAATDAAKVRLLLDRGANAESREQAGAHRAVRRRDDAKARRRSSGC